MSPFTKPPGAFRRLFSYNKIFREAEEVEKISASWVVPPPDPHPRENLAPSLQTLTVRQCFNVKVCYHIVQLF